MALGWRDMEPMPQSRWLARHRRPVRVVALVADAAVLWFVGAGVQDGTVRWSSWVLLVTYAGMTWNFGWYLPAQVDRWDQRNDPGASPVSPPQTPR